MSVEEKILSALGHSIRRSIIEVLAEEGPKGFTELMNKVNVKDTGTMTFHLKKLGRLIKKNEDGEYQLTELGRHAYRVLQYAKTLHERGEEQVQIREVEQRRAETEYSINLPTSIKELSIELVAGSLGVVQSDEKPIMKIHIGGQCDFDIDTEHNRLDLELTGCSSKVVLPKSKLEKIDVEVAGGKLNFDNPSGFKTASIEVSGGAISLNSHNLRESKLSIESNGGIAYIRLEYNEYEGESSINIEVDGGVVNLEATVPRNTQVKPMLPSKHLGSVIHTKIDPDLLEVLEPKRRLHLRARSEGGVIILKISKRKE